MPLISSPARPAEPVRPARPRWAARPGSAARPGPAARPGGAARAGYLAPAATGASRAPDRAGRGSGGAGRSPWFLAAAVAVALAGAVLVPLGTLAAAGRGMPEVGVTERAAALLLQHGSPYL